MKQRLREMRQPYQAVMLVARDFQERPMSSNKIRIAIPVGDPAGIGPEICLKAVLDPQVRAACDPIIVCDPALLERHAKACGLNADVDVLPCPQPETATLGFGVTSPIAGRASIAFC